MPPYGYCPLCQTPGVYRERRPNGNDRCGRGHEYPSIASLPAPIPAVPPLSTTAQTPHPQAAPEAGIAAGGPIQREVRERALCKAANHLREWVPWGLDGTAHERNIADAVVLNTVIEIQDLDNILARLKAAEAEVTALRNTLTQEREAAAHAAAQLPAYNEIMAILDGLPVINPGPQAVRLVEALAKAKAEGETKGRIWSNRQYGPG